jgi:hypothetical protein
VKFRATVVAVLLLLAGCGGEDGGGASQPAAEAPKQIVGIVTEVESSGLNDVSSFKVKEEETIYEIFIDEAMNYGFPLGHIEEHRTTAAPVEVEVEEIDGKLYAREILDASG